MRSLMKMVLKAQWESQSRLYWTAVFVTFCSTIALFVACYQLHGFWIGLVAATVANNVGGLVIYRLYSVEKFVSKLNF